MINEIHSIYKEKKSEIVARISDFKRKWIEADESLIFHELLFCLLTPQAKAKNAWNAVERLIESGDLYKGDKKIISTYLNTVRFKNNKASYILEARNKFLYNGNPKIIDKISENIELFEKRKWLVKNIKGFGFKEASHFLRNIGFVEEITILDRHIIRNLKLLDIIKDIPNSISELKYYEIEKKMLIFSENIQIPAEHLDLLFWYKENGEIFK